MSTPGTLREAFRARFGSEAHFFHAPGRVNLIGEHTDYNAGFVMPVAIQFRTKVGIAPRLDRCLRVHSMNFDATEEGALTDFSAEASPYPQGHWMNYVLGVALSLEKHGLRLPGADILIQGEVPLGSGLSSSAALEVAVGLALASLSGQRIDPFVLARICQSAEHDYVGNRCGIMDQLASACGRAGHALLIDCRTLALRPISMEAHLDKVRLIICNTMVRHQLAGSEYNRRRDECEAGVRSMAATDPGIHALRDVTLEMLEARRQHLDPTVFRRCRHVILENERVCAAADALEAADLERFGKLMQQSHESLRDDYQVSCDELDLMVELASQVAGVYGARMTGGGFGGCTVNLVAASAAPHFLRQVAERYTKATGHHPEFYVCQAVDGAAAVSVQ